MDSKAGAIIIVAFAFMIGWILWETYAGFKSQKFQHETDKAHALLQQGLDYEGSQWLKPIRYYDLVKYSEENYDRHPYWSDHSQKIIRDIQNGDMYKG
jgi:hypothetical protein